MNTSEGRRRPGPSSIRSPGGEGSPTLPRQASRKHPKSPSQKIQPSGAILRQTWSPGDFAVATGFEGQGQGQQGLLSLTSRAGLSSSALARETPKLQRQNVQKELEAKAMEAAAARVAASSQFGWSVRNLYRQFFYPLLSLPAIYNTNSEAKRSRRVFEALGLTEREVAFLHQYYTDIDADGSGTISRAELLAYLDIPSRRYFHRVFEMFDEDQSGQVDFREFVLAVWNYASLPSASLIQFTFDLYDHDQSGILDASEVQRIIHDCYGTTLESNAAAYAISSELSKPGNMAREGFDVKSFSVFAAHHALLLMPAFTHQQRMRERLGGETFWRPATEKRLELSSGQYILIQVLMKARMARSVSSALSRIDTSTLLLDSNKRPGRRSSDPKPLINADGLGGSVSVSQDLSRGASPPTTQANNVREGRRTFPASAQRQRRGSSDKPALPVSPALLFMKTMHDTVSSRRRIQVDRDDDDDDLDVEELEERQAPTGAGGEKGQQRGQQQNPSPPRLTRERKQKTLERSIRARDTAESILQGYVAKGGQH